MAAGFFLDAVSLFGLPYRYGLPPIRRSNDARVDTVMLRAPLVQRFKRVVTYPTVVVQIEDDPLQIADRLHRRAGTTLSSSSGTCSSRWSSTTWRTKPSTGSTCPAPPPGHW